MPPCSTLDMLSLACYEYSRGLSLFSVKYQQSLMTLQNIPSEILLHIADYLDSERDISRLTQASKRLDERLHPYLYRRNVERSNVKGYFGSALDWGFSEEDGEATVLHFLGQVRPDDGPMLITVGLYDAIRHMRINMAILLLAHGADVNLPVNGKSALHTLFYTHINFIEDDDENLHIDWSLLRQSSEAVERMAILLIGYGAKVDILDDCFFSWACTFTTSSFVQLLLQQGARIDGRNSFGRTPLHVALRRSAVWGYHSRNDEDATRATNGDDDSSQILMILLYNGADPDAEDKYGVSPRDLATQYPRLLALFPPPLPWWL